MIPYVFWSVESQCIEPQLLCPNKFKRFKRAKGICRHRFRYFESDAAMNAGATLACKLLISMAMFFNLYRALVSLPVNFILLRRVLSSSSKR